MTEIDVDKAIDLKLEGYSWPAVAQKMGFNDLQAIDRIRNRCRRHPRYAEIQQANSSTKENETRYQ